MHKKMNFVVVPPEELKDQSVITTLDQLFYMDLMDIQFNKDELLAAFYDRTLFLGKEPERPVTVVYGSGATPYFNIREATALMGKVKDIDAFISDHYDEIGVSLRFAGAPHRLELIELLPTVDAEGLHRLAELLGDQADPEGVAIMFEVLEEKAVAWGKQCYA